MKKFLLLCVSLSLVFGLTGASFASVSDTYEAAVISIVGVAKVDTKGDGIWIAPWVGMKLKENAIIRTGADSSVQIVFDAEGLNVVKIGKNSQITVKRSSVELPEGTVLTDFRNLTEGSSFVVKTPTAACGIRGSGMGVEVFDQITSIMAFEHSVYVQGLDANGNLIGREVEIPEGWKTIIDQGGNIEPPAELTENEKAIFEAWVQAQTGGGEDDGGDDEDDGGEEPDPKDLDEEKGISPSS